MSNPTITVTVPPVKTEVFFHCAGCNKTTSAPRPSNWSEFSVRAQGHEQKIILCPDCSGTSADFIRGTKKPSSSCYTSRTEFATYRCSFCLFETRRCVYPSSQVGALGANPWTGFAFITIPGTGYGPGHADQHFLCCPECVKTKLTTTAAG